MLYAAAICAIWKFHFYMEKLGKQRKERFTMNEKKQKVYRLMAVSYGYIDVPADSAKQAMEDADALCANRDNFDWTAPTNLRIIEEI